MRYAICTYGNKYMGMTLVCIHSILRADAKAEVFLFWQDVRDVLVTSLQTLASGDAVVRSIKTDFHIPADATKRISMKAKFWTFAMKHLHTLGEKPTAFLDNDLLILQSLDPAFEQVFDVGLTVKPEIWPLNNGVMFSVCSERALKLFERYLERTEAIVANPDLLAVSVSRSHSFGAPDQMAMYEVANVSQLLALERLSSDCKVHLLECEIFNETRSVPIGSETKVVHFKGGWHSILVNGSIYTKNRPMHSCREMHLAYLKEAREALHRLEKCGMSHAPADWHLAFPAYLNEKTGQVAWGSYFWRYCLDTGAKLVRRLKRI